MASIRALDGATRRQLICWSCGGPHAKADSREKNWTPCKVYCKAVGKAFRPPGPPRQQTQGQTGVAAISTSSPDFDPFDIATPSRADGIALMASTSVDFDNANFSDVPADAWIIDCAATFTINGNIAEFPTTALQTMLAYSG